MLVPRFWARAEGQARGRDGQSLALRVWGWSQDSAADALEVARRRIAEVTSRLASGHAAGAYLYGVRQPLREEIIRHLSSDGRGQALITRNRYGALVLNAAQVPFIDVDSAPPSGLRLMQRWFGRSADDPALERIREACRRHPTHAFRIYRTHSGYRVLVTTVALDPASDQARQFLEGFGADPQFVTLCRLQRSFRARLTPKPWRCGLSAPPGQHPRDVVTQQAFAAWLLQYDTAARAHATCRLVESIGTTPPLSESRAVVDEHDRATRIAESLPLA